MATTPSGRDPIEQQLLDRVALEAVMARYFQGIDRNDLAQVRSCFTEDVKGTYANRGTVTGVDPMLAMLRPHFEAMTSGAIRVCTHFMGTFNADRIEADRAETETYALAFLVRAAGTAQNSGDADVIAMRSLRYLDRWRRGGDNGFGWQICERIHTLDWSTQVTPDFAAIMAKRVMRLP